jgi:bifunctional non-homologous end joining protein LigD
LPRVKNTWADENAPRRSNESPNVTWRLVLHVSPVSSLARPKGEGRAAVLGVEISHPDRVLYPDSGITKLELARYYESVADLILPHVAGRPLSIVRCPDGLHPGGARPSNCFFQKHTSRSTSASIRSVRVPEQSGFADYLAIDDAKGLVALVQYGTLELHPWGARASKQDSPDRMFLDLDPGPGVSWSAVSEAALAVRELLEEVELRSFLKTTGGKGMHVVVPLSGRNTWDEIKTFSAAVAARLAQREPEKYVATMVKRVRQGKIFIDYLRNARGSTAVAPYSTRARPGAPVSTPVAWNELEQVRGDTFHLRNLSRRLRRRDPWKGFAECKQAVTKTMSRQIGSLAARSATFGMTAH